MINMFLNNKQQQAFYFKQQNGVTILIVTVILLVATLLIAIFAAHFSLLQTKTAANQNRSNQAFAAAEAGLEYGIVYLIQNRSTILANPSSGFINYSNANISNVTLANNAKYSIVYTNPIANNYKLITIKSTGVSDDNTSTKIVSQMANQGSLLATVPVGPVSIIGGVTMSGNTSVVNSTSNISINSGSTVTLNGSSSTTSATSGSNRTTTGSDIQQNNSSLQNMTTNDFFLLYFGASMTDVKNNVTYLYPSGSTPNLSGITGASIWVDQSLSLAGNITIGTAANPVILIINGDLTISGSPIIYGFIYVIGNVSTGVTGNPQIIGGIAATGNLNLQGNASITFDSSVIDGVFNQISANYFAKVPGTWKDF